MMTISAARLISRLARFRPIQAWLHRLASTYKQEQISSAQPACLEVGEILSIDPRLEVGQLKTRINLMIPALSSRHVFGGIETALQVLDILRSHFDQVRIIVTDESCPEPRPDTYYGQWPIIDLDHQPLPDHHIVAAGSRWGKTLAIHAQDFFMATAWWTAHCAFSILDWQRQKFPSTRLHRLLYLIQDFEPGFYPWSTRYVLAQATYGQPQHTVAVINSQELADYLVNQDHWFPIQHVLHPQLHPKLMAERNIRASFQKERLLLIYGRPGTERNAFTIIVAALRIWVRSYSAASQWRIVSAGESFAPIDLGNSCQLLSVGKVGIGEYAHLLSQSAVGISLMISPHPSYPPLEMAAFGVRVLTNKFANKDLAKLSSFLNSVDQPDPPSLARALTTLTEKFDESVPAQSIVHGSDIDWQGDFLKTGNHTTEWAPFVASALRGPGVFSPGSPGV